VQVTLKQLTVPGIYLALAVVALVFLPGQQEHVYTEEISERKMVKHERILLEK
jgi:hypothetical protein